MTLRILFLLSSLLWGLSLPAWAGSGTEPERAQLVRRDEGRLLNQAVSPMHVSANLRVLDPLTDTWLSME